MEVNQMNQLTTGKFISKKRKEKNLTQEQLAEKLGVSNKTISKWETGKCMPDYGFVKADTRIRETKKSVIWNFANSNGNCFTSTFAYLRRV